MAIVDSDLITYREIAEKIERDHLFELAALSKHHLRAQAEPKDHRMPYKRDVDRIMHSKAYARYVGKTQVVYLVDNDHITHRGLHVQFVSSFSRGIAEILRLNLALVEAISLGHDVGHAPFGHEGESYLSKLSQEYLNIPFSHPLQSCRLFSLIEPLNLGLAVYDGFLCHDGGLVDPVLQPKFSKVWNDHLEEREIKKHDAEVSLIPATLEGCLVKICDTISYIGKDIEDAIQLGIITRDQIPETCLGTTNQQMLTVLSTDILKNSYQKNYIALSDECFEALKQLRQFNFEKIYHHPRLKKESSKIAVSFRLLFNWLLQDIKENGLKSYLWRTFISNKSQPYIDSTSEEEQVIDYISGMTDSFFISSVEKFMLPRKIEWSTGGF